MKKKLLVLLMAMMAVGTGMMVTSCTSDDNPVTDPVTEPEQPLPAARISMIHNKLGALSFVAELTTVICHYLQISPWFTITAEELAGV